MSPTCKSPCNERGTVGESDNAHNQQKEDENEAPRFVGVNGRHQRIVVDRAEIWVVRCAVWTLLRGFRQESVDLDLTESSI